MKDPVFWISFNLFILLMLAFDLGFVNRKEKVISFRESIAWVAFWCSLAIAFNGLVYYWFGPVKAFEFLTGYIIEWSLSVDNLFVFIVIFSFFEVPRQYQYKVLFYGIIGALILRCIFIVLGVSLFSNFTWISYLFGAILIFTGIKMFFQNPDEQHDLEQNPLVKFCRKYLPFTDHYHGSRFMIVDSGRRLMTPLFIVLVVVEFTDLIFAIDSIPAVLSISNDPFIVYTSNVFAILGLRSLFFAISGMMDLFRFLRYGLAVILSFVGLKMFLAHFMPVPIEWALTTVVLVLSVSIALSLFLPKK